jgi:hypothetical protein
MPTCKVCNEEKSQDGFYATPKGYRRVCKACCINYSVERQRNDPSIQRWKQLKHNYGLTKSDWFDLLEKQGHKCAICFTVLHTDAIKRNDKRPPNQAVIDHCHSTNKVRGILCHRCNVALGHFTDDIDILASAIEYIRSNK